MMELNEDSVAVEAVVRAATMLVLDRATKHGINLRVSMPRSVPRIRADEVRLKQILINLLSNAVKFTPDNGDVHVLVDRSPAGGLAFIVRDTGIGMAIEDIPRIQESFVQLDDPTNKRYDGTGLGVPLAIAMAKLHGGSITYDSQLGAGTTVTLELPAERVLHDPEFEPLGEAEIITFDHDHSATFRRN
jgi:signal transduction histidine kinase